MMIYRIFAIVFSALFLLAPPKEDKFKMYPSAVEAPEGSLFQVENPDPEKSKKIYYKDSISGQVVLAEVDEPYQCIEQQGEFEYVKLVKNGGFYSVVPATFNEMMRLCDNVKARFQVTNYKSEHRNSLYSVLCVEYLDPVTLQPLS